MKIGVLALQGDFDAHRRRLEELGAEVVLVKNPEQLDAIDGLVIPGGESGTFLKLLGEDGFAKLKDFVHAKPTFGTCAGAILLATEVENPKQVGLGALNIRIRRNAYGRQIDSSIREGLLGTSPIEMVFIRAPKIEHVGEGVEVIATEGTDPVAVRQGRSMAATFHPELSEDPRIHQVFLDLVQSSSQENRR
jgi:pyridoxal 5'-phosphate synthase pdxT subunit